MTTTTSQLSSSALLWKQLMDNGVFDECYPQRLNASFHYLCSDNIDPTAFSLKDLIQKGSYVFTYLSIDVDKDSSFAIMDIFRTFDRSGRGIVFLEDFVLGILERLNAIKKNTVLLESIAEDLLSIESRCTELATLLEKERVNNSIKFTNYNRNLKSLSSIIRSYVRSSKATQFLSALDIPGFIRIFEKSIIQAAAEVQVYFHIPDSRMTGMLADLTLQRDQLKVAHPLRMIWNMNSSSAAGEGNSLQATNLTLSEDSSRELITRVGGGGSGGEDSDLWLKDSPEQLLSNLLGGVDESRFKRLRFDGNQHHFESQQEMMHLLKDLLPPETMMMLQSGYISDNVQLHVLQDAFISINNFFQLQHPNMILLNDQVENSTSTGAGNSSSRSLTGERGMKPLNSAGSAPSPGSGTPSNKKKLETALKLSEYRELLGLGKDMASRLTPSSSNTISPDDAENESTVLIAVLTEDLLRTQEQLQRTQQRLKILELIQSDMMAEHFRQQEQDKEKERQRNNVMASVFQHHQQQQQQAVGFGEDNSHSSYNTMNGNSNRAISDRINNHNPRFHGEGGLGGGDGVESTGLLDEYTPLNEDQITLHHEDTVTYEDILKELASLETSLAERSLTDYALGLLLDRPITIIDENSSPALSLNPSNSSASNFSTMQNSSNIANPQTIIESTSSLVEKIAEEMKFYLEHVSKRDHLAIELKNKEALIMDYRTKMEQIDIERNEWISTNAELQILREKLQKYQKEEHSSKILEQKNQDLLKKIHSLEEQLVSFQEIDTKYQKDSKLSTPSPDRFSNENQPTSRNASTSSATGIAPNPSSGAMSAKSSNASHSSNEEVEKLKDSLQQLQTANVELTQQNEQYQKEIQRLKTTINLSEQRVKSILQDSMILHQNIQILEEENINAKATVTKLLREVEDMKNLRQYKEETERKLFEYQKEMTKFEVELAESRENNIIINKYHNDLITAERTIESLEQKLAEYSVELEKGKIASSQLENYRESMKTKLQEIRDLSLYIHQLENQLKDVPYLNTRYQELSSELSECKVKVDKIPGLLAEIARLRGSSRASIKALMEQDKLISTMKGRLKLLEKDNTLLKHENQSLLDLEMKVKEANQEIKRLMNIITDLQSSGGGPREAIDRASSGGHLAHKAMSIMMLNKFASGASLHGGESDDGSPTKGGGANASNTVITSASAKKIKRYSQGVILPISPLSRTNSSASTTAAGGVGAGGGSSAIGQTGNESSSATVANSETSTSTPNTHTVDN